MLGHENGVAAVRSLLAVVVRLGRRQPLGDEIVGVPPQGGRVTQLGLDSLGAAQMELRAKRAPREGVQSLVERVRH